jgi:hypothetical protein
MGKKRYGVVIVAVLVAVIGVCVRPAPAQEKLVLASPALATVGATEFRVESVYLKRDHPDAPAEIRAIFRELTPGTVTFAPNGRALSCRYDGDDAETLVRALNTTNLSTASLERRVTLRCQSDNKIAAGTITGSAQ